MSAPADKVKPAGLREQLARLEQLVVKGKKATLFDKAKIAEEAIERNVQLLRAIIEKLEPEEKTDVEKT